MCTSFVNQISCSSYWTTTRSSLILLFIFYFYFFYVVDFWWSYSTIFLFYTFYILHVIIIINRLHIIFSLHVNLLIGIHHLIKLLVRTESLSRIHSWNACRSFFFDSPLPRSSTLFVAGHHLCSYVFSRDERLFSTLIGNE